MTRYSTDKLDTVLVNVPEEVKVWTRYEPVVVTVPPEGNAKAVLLTAADVTPSELVAVTATTFPDVTLLYTAEGTVTVAAVSEVGVTVTSASIESEICKKLTTRFEDKKPDPASVNVDVAPAYIFPVTLVRIGVAAETLIQLAPSE
jgi:hypothetical protein